MHHDLHLVIIYDMICVLEKERDAFSEAYEASIFHFEKWTKGVIKN